MYRRAATGVTVLLAVGLGAWLTSPAAALEWLTWLAADPIRFGVVLLGLTLVRPFLAWPTTLLAVAVGYGYGWAGVPLGIAAMTLTALPPYYLARRAGGGRVTAAGEWFVGAAGGGLRTVIASRLLPTPSDVISIGAGVSRVPLRPFLAGTAVGETPWVVAGVIVGSSVDRLVAGDVSGVMDLHLLLGMAAAGTLLIAGPLYRTVCEEPTVA